MALWRGHGAREDLKDISEQRLTNQVSQIKTKKWLEKRERHEITARGKGEQWGVGNNATTVGRSEWKCKE